MKIFAAHKGNLSEKYYENLTKLHLDYKNDETVEQLPEKFIRGAMKKGTLITQKIENLDQRIFLFKLIIKKVDIFLHYGNKHLSKLNMKGSNSINSITLSSYFVKYKINSSFSEFLILFK